MYNITYSEPSFMPSTQPIDRTTHSKFLNLIHITHNTCTIPYIVSAYHSVYMCAYKRKYKIRTITSNKIKKCLILL